MEGYKIVFRYDPNDIINFQMAPAIIEMFDRCYKQGVVHAFQFDDINAAMKFVINNRQPSHYATLCDTDIFGRLVGGRVYPFDKWRILISNWVRSARQSNLLRKFFDMVRTERSYAGVVYPLCMDFYLQGIYHFIQNPATDIMVFVKTKMVTFQPTRKKNVYPSRNVDKWLQDIQLLCMERAELEDEHPGDKRPISKRSYDNFARLMWNCINGRRNVLREQRRIKVNEQRRNKRKNKNL